MKINSDSILLHDVTHSCRKTEDAFDTAARVTNLKPSQFELTTTLETVRPDGSIDLVHVMIQI